MKTKTLIPTALKGIIVASGRATHDIFHVFGTCTSTTLQPQVTINGEVIAYHREPKTSTKASFYRWMIAFQFTQADTYTLSVDGVTASGATGNPDTVTFPVKFAHPFGISSPNDNDDISDEAEDFVAYGDVSGNPIGGATMVDATTDPHNPTTISADYIYSDTTDLQIWSAQFPAIPAGGTWTLTVTDTSVGGNPQRVVGLTS